MSLRVTFTLRAFYFGTWWALTSLTLLNALVSGVAAGPIVGFALLLSLPSLVPSLHRKLDERGRRVITVLSLIYLAVILALAVFDYQGSHNVVTLVGWTLVAMLPWVLSRKRDEHGNWMALLLSFLVSQVSVIAGEEAIEFLLFILFSLSFVLNLNAAHLYFHLGAFESTRTRVPRHYFPSFFYSTGFGLALAVGLFFLFPRSIGWANPFGLRQKSKSMGYTGSVSLDGKSLQESSDVAMRIEMSDEHWLSREGPKLYLRGNTVEHFDGVRWKLTHTPLSAYRSARSLRLTSLAENRVAFMRIYREPSEGNWVFYPGVLREVVGPERFRAELRVDRFGNLSREDRREDSGEGSARFAYEIGFSNVGPVLPALTDTSVQWVREEIARHADRYLGPAGLGGGTAPYLALPATITQRDFFRRWTKELKVDPARASVGEVMAELLREFHRRYKSTYVHDMPSANSFEYFLTQGREGHCEYFATASALYLRSLGIPARMVLGYHGGVFNSVAKVLEVKESNAHAWVELFVPGMGWVPFDPTPVRIVAEVPGTWDYIGFAISAVRFWFERYVVQYNSATQLQLVKQLTQWKSRDNATKGRWHWPRGQFLWLIVAVLALWAGLLWRRKPSRRGRRGAPPLPEYYRLFQRKLKAKGYERAPGETFAAFHRRLRAMKPPPGCLDRVDAALEREIYAEIPSSPQEREALKQEVRFRA